MSGKSSLVAGIAHSLIQTLAYPLINAISGKEVMRAGKVEESGLKHNDLMGEMDKKV